MTRKTLRVYYQYNLLAENFQTRVWTQANKTELIKLLYNYSLYKTLFLRILNKCMKNQNSNKKTLQILGG